MFDFVLTEETPEGLTGDKACDRDEPDEMVAEHGLVRIPPHLLTGIPKNVTQHSST